jgi:hypothetical protein
MSKAEALDSLSDKAVAMMLAHIGISASDVERIEDIVSAYQTFAGLKADGWPGSNTMSDLWRRHRPTPAEIVEAATSALPWQTVYSQTNNLGMGESWFEEGPFKAGDCSDFASHCIGAPKKQVKAYGVLSLTGATTSNGLPLPSLRLERLASRDPGTQRGLATSLRSAARARTSKLLSLTPR